MKIFWKEIQCTNASWFFLPDFCLQIVTERNVFKRIICVLFLKSINQVPMDLGNDTYQSWLSRTNGKKEEKKIKHTQCMEGIFCDVDRRSVSQWGQNLYEFVIESACTISQKAMLTSAHDIFSRTQYSTNLRIFYNKYFSFSFWVFLWD